MINIIQEQKYFNLAYRYYRLGNNKKKKTGPRDGARQCFVWRRRRRVCGEGVVAKHLSHDGKPAFCCYCNWRENGAIR